MQPSLQNILRFGPPYKEFHLVDQSIYFATYISCIIGEKMVKLRTSVQEHYLSYELQMKMQVNTLVRVKIGIIVLSLENLYFL